MNEEIPKPETIQKENKEKEIQSITESNSITSSPPGVKNDKKSKRIFPLRFMAFLLKLTNRIVKSQGTLVSIFTVFGVLLGAVPVYYSYWYSKDNLVGIVCDFQNSIDDFKPGVTIVFENKGNKKAIISNIDLTISPASGSKVLPKLIDLPNGEKFTSWGTIPAKSGLVYDSEDNENLYFVVPFTKPQTSILGPGESMVKECEIDKKSLEIITEQFTEDTVFNLGILVKAVNSEGKLFVKKVPIAITKGKSFQNFEYKDSFPKSFLVMPSKISHNLLGSGQFTVSATQTVKIELPRKK